MPVLLFLGKRQWSILGASINQRSLPVEEYWIVRQLNYNTWSREVAFSNGFGFFFFFPRRKLPFLWESPSFSLLRPSRHIWKTLLLWEWFLPTRWWQLTSGGFLFFSELSSVTPFLPCLEPRRSACWKVLSVLVREARRGETTSLGVPFRKWIPQDLILLWPISPLNCYPPPRGVNRGVSDSLPRALCIHRCQALPKHNFWL